jgi:hypothetical protein
MGRRPFFSPLPFRVPTLNSFTIKRIPLRTAAPLAGGGLMSNPAPIPPNEGRARSSRC